MGSMADAPFDPDEYQAELFRREDRVFPSIALRDWQDHIQWLVLHIVVIVEQDDTPLLDDLLWRIDHAVNEVRRLAAPEAEVS